MNPIPEALTRGKPVTVRPYEEPEYEVLRDYTLNLGVSPCVYINVGDQTVYIEYNEEDGLFVDTSGDPYPMQFDKQHARY